MIWRQFASMVVEPQDGFWYPQISIPSMSAELKEHFLKQRNLISGERDWLGGDNDGMRMPEAVAGYRADWAA